MHIPMVARPYIDEILATNHLINQSINLSVCLSVCLSVSLSVSAFHLPIAISGIYSPPRCYFCVTLTSRDLRQSETRDARNI